MEFLDIFGLFKWNSAKIYGLQLFSLRRDINLSLKTSYERFESVIINPEQITNENNNKNITTLIEAGEVGCLSVGRVTRYHL